MKILQKGQNLRLKSPVDKNIFVEGGEFRNIYKNIRFNCFLATEHFGLCHRNRKVKVNISVIKQCREYWEAKHLIPFCLRRLDTPPPPPHPFSFLTPSPNFRTEVPCRCRDFTPRWSQSLSLNDIMKVCSSGDIRFRSVCLCDSSAQEVPSGSAKLLQIVSSFSSLYILPSGFIMQTLFSVYHFCYWNNTNESYHSSDMIYKGKTRVEISYLSSQKWK